MIHESTDSTSSSLLARAKSRDQEAWRRLVELYGPLVHAWCARGGIQEEDLADVFQEVFTAVASKIDQFRREQPTDSFRAWLYTITRNKLHDFYRRRAAGAQAAGGSTAHERMHQLAEAPSSVFNGPGEADATLARRALELIQAEFEPNTWRAFWRVAVDGRSPKETGLELGMTAVAVRKAKSRVLRRLREEFGDLLDFPDK